MDQTTGASSRLPAHSCGPGWSRLVEATAKRALTFDPSCRFVVVRERWGLLEVTMEASRPELQIRLDALTEEVRQASSMVCEVSGRPGVLMVSDLGWFRTLDPLSAPAGWDIVELPPHVSQPAELHLLRILTALHRSKA